MSVLYIIPSEKCSKTFSGRDGMKALTITNESVRREALLGMAERIPGAWIGIRIAALLLLLEGWKSSQIARLFGLTRWSVVRWIQGVNDKGLLAVEAKKQPGRPCRLDKRIQRALEKDLEKSPRALGLKRNRWDGVVVVEYLERVHGVRLKVRQAQRWIRRLGFSLRQPIYRYAQARTEGVEEFRKTVKKTPDDQKK
jgi:transposase